MASVRSDPPKLSEKNLTRTEPYPWTQHAITRCPCPIQHGAHLYADNEERTQPLGAVRMTDGYVAIASDENGHIDGQHLSHVHQWPDERLQIDAEPVVRYADVQRRRGEYL